MAYLKSNHTNQLKIYFQLDKKVLECWSNPNKTGCAEKSAAGKLDRLLKVYCDESGPNGTHTEVSLLSHQKQISICFVKFLRSSNL